MQIESSSNVDYTMDYNPSLLMSIIKDVDAAKTHLNSHVTIDEEILTLDKNCEYCQIYFKEYELI
jgi:hypothetical protein